MNELVQIHSRERIFYKGKAPEFISAYQMNEFACVDDKSNHLISLLDDIVKDAEVVV